MTIHQGFQLILHDNRDHQHPQERATASVYSPLSVSATVRDPETSSLTEGKVIWALQAGTMPLLSLRGSSRRQIMDPLTLKRFEGCRLL